MRFEGKVALVTGASTGIGKATAMMFAKEGAKVVLAARGEAKLKAAAEEIEAVGGEVAIVAGDASKEEDCKKMVDVAVSTYGGLHIAFNNHGIHAVASFAEITDELATSILDINLKSLIFCFKYHVGTGTMSGTAAPIPAMAKSGDKGSIIVNTSALGNRVTCMLGPCGVYSASKAGADMLVKYAAMEGAPSGIRVNAVAPGHVFTPIYGSMTIEQLTEVTKKDSLISRPIQPEEIGELVMFLASDASSAVTASIYNMDGGFSVKG